MELEKCSESQGREKPKAANNQTKQKTDERLNILTTEWSVKSLNGLFKRQKLVC